MVERATFHYGHPLPTDPAFPGGPATILYLDEAIRRGIEKFEEKNGSVDYDDLILMVNFDPVEIRVVVNSNKTK